MVAPFSEKAGAVTERPQTGASEVLCVSHCLGGGGWGTGVLIQVHTCDLCALCGMHVTLQQKAYGDATGPKQPRTLFRLRQGERRTQQPALNQDYRIEGSITMTLNPRFHSRL